MSENGADDGPPNNAHVTSVRIALRSEVTSRPLSANSVTEPSVESRAPARRARTLRVWGRSEVLAKNSKNFWAF